MSARVFELCRVTAENDQDSLILPFVSFKVSNNTLLRWSAVRLFHKNLQGDTENFFFFKQKWILVVISRHPSNATQFPTVFFYLLKCFNFTINSPIYATLTLKMTVKNKYPFWRAKLLFFLFTLWCSNSNTPGDRPQNRLFSRVRKCRIRQYPLSTYIWHVCKV